MIDCVKAGWEAMHMRAPELHMMVLLEEVSHDTQAHGHNYQQRDLRRFFKQNSHQLGCVAHQIHLCIQGTMSDESKLAPHPRL